MCGIVGIVCDNAESYKELIEKMKSTIAHRGPDGDGTKVFDQCILGHVRLSIIDISGGTQPMCSANHQTSIVFNGEIYNYLELEEKINYDFKTKSDTEVLLALYALNQENFLDKLSGMFSFALWDAEQKKLFCARDRFGEKPFYYTHGKNGEFIFASELKAIVASGLADLTLDKASLAHYMQRLYVPVNKTIYKNIHILPAAHQLTYQDSRLTISKYWDLPNENDISLDEAVDKFTFLFDKAVQRQLIADVDTGAFLSGGLDSSSIVAKASKFNKRLKTFSFGFEGETSELPYARDVAKLYKTDHYEFEETELDLASLIVEMQSVYDEPFADSSNIPTYVISKYASEHVKVVLSGDGADELLGGYDYWYRPLYNMQHFDDQTAGKYFLARLLRKIISKIPFTSHNNLNNYINGYRLNKKYSSIAEAKLNQNIYFSDAELANMGLSAVNKPIVITQNGTVNDALRIDILDYMPGDILTKVDRASMANSLEVRAPFLDPDFASFCISLPGSLKIDSLSSKKIMRHACAELWPESVQNRPKQGFGATVSDWLQLDEMKQLKTEFLEDETKKIHTFLDRNATRKYIVENNYKTWILLVLSIWMESHEFH